MMAPLGSTIPDWLLNTIIGYDEGANLHHPQQIHDNRSINQGLSSSTSCGFPRWADCSGLLAGELEKQREEMDWLLQVENQRLRMIVQEKSRQHATLFLKYESKVMDFISQKDKDLELARSRSLELQSFLMRAQEDNEALKKKVMETEAMVLELNSKLEQVKAGNLDCWRNPNVFNETHDVESYCESSNRACREEEEEEEMEKIGCCKQCKNGRLDVVFLPCQHLCCCTSCEPLLPLCPVCQAVKGTSLEVFFD